ncbi:hypothetical protein ACHAPU_009180 [Fusarium lateritium]
MSRDVDPEQSDMGHVKLKFTSENRQPHQTAKEARSFWECRSPKVLQEASRKYFERCGQMPCFYEYFLINVPYFFPHPPVIEYVTWPRRHVHRKEPLDADMVRRLITEDVLGVRESCPHLRAVTWATASADSSDEHSPRDTWLKHYRNGIRYNWNRGNLVQWRLQWRTRSAKDFLGENPFPDLRNAVRLCSSWECSSCCDEAYKSVSELANASEETCDRPVLPRKKQMSL